MTGAAQQHPRLPVDVSPPPERLRWKGLLGVAAVVLALHLSLVSIFTPLAPERNEGRELAEHSSLFVSSRTAAAFPDFQKMADMYDPISFLHPQKEYGFSFRLLQDDLALDAPSEPFLPPQRPDELKPLPPYEPEPVARQLAGAVAGEADDADTEVVPVSALSYPYCVADSRPQATFPAILLDARSERILRRSPPVRPSVFEIREISAAILPVPDSGSGELPRCESVLTESCGAAELDLAARAWLDTFANSREGAALRHGDKCRVIWSARALGKEPSAR